MKSKNNYIEEYKAQVDAGEIIVGEWIRRLLSRLEDGFAAGEFFYDGDKAARAVDFIETFGHHSEGSTDRLRLELWQKAFIASIFGIVDEDGVRQFREVMLVVARKMGKSLMCSAIAEYLAILDGEYGAMIYCVAPKLEQAHKVYDGFYQMLEMEPAFRKYYWKRRTDVYFPDTNTSVRPIAFNAKKSDGLNPHAVIADEISAWPAEQGRKQYEVLRSAFGARKQPLMISITTAGYVNDGPYDDLFARSTAYLTGASSEKRLLPWLYVIDDPGKWNDLDELAKSNPNLGVSVQPDFYGEEIAIAETSLSKKAEFLTKYCNIKQSSTAAWLPWQVVDDCCTEEIAIEDFRSSYCVGGIDLSQTTDLTSACVVIERNEKLYVFSRFFMPENKIDELSEREGVPYRIYVAQGLLTPSGENFVDYNDVFTWYRQLVEDYEILPLQVGYDRYSAQYLVQDMTAYGFHMDDVYQGFNLSPVIQEMEGLIRDRRLEFGKNNLLKQHLLNAAVKFDQENKKMKLVKVEQRAHIDGAAALLDALTVRQKWYDQIGEQLKNN